MFNWQETPCREDPEHTGETLASGPGNTMGTSRNKWSTLERREGHLTRATVSQLWISRRNFVDGWRNTRLKLISYSLF